MGARAASDDMKEIEVFTKKNVPSRSLGKAYHYFDIVNLLAEYIKENYKFEESLKESNMSRASFPDEDSLSARVLNKLKKTEIKKWYAKNFSDDELKDDLIDGYTFGDLFNDLSEKVFDYACCADDSVVRERVFGELSKMLGVEYDAIYYRWLDSADKGKPFRPSGPIRHGLGS